MSGEEQQQADPAKPARGFTAEEARQRAQQARQKAEFILSRAYGLMRDPKAEWEQIKAEETNIASILLGYVAPLTAFFSLCVLIGSLIFEGRPIGGALVDAVITAVLMTGLVALIGYVISAVAESFDADKDELAAQKVAAYSFTPFFLSGVFWLWPPLLWLTFVAVGISAFLLYRGLPPLMKTPADRAMGYATAIGIASIVGFLIAAILVGCFASTGIAPVPRVAPHA